MHQLHLISMMSDGQGESWLHPLSGPSERSFSKLFRSLFSSVTIPARAFWQIAVSYLSRIQELDEDNSGHVHKNAEQSTGTTGRKRADKPGRAFWLGQWQLLICSTVQAGPQAAGAGPVIRRSKGRRSVAGLRKEKTRFAEVGEEIARDNLAGCNA